MFLRFQFGTSKVQYPAEVKYPAASSGTWFIARGNKGGADMAKIEETSSLEIKNGLSVSNVETER